MNLLAFECANFMASAALVRDGVCCTLQEIAPFYDQDALLLPVIEEMLASQNIWYNDLSAVVTTRGPGSFTGIRLALATAQGLSFASDVPCAAFSVFDWWAWDFQSRYGQPSADLVVALEAKRAEVYVQVFRQAGAGIVDPACILPGELDAYVGHRDYVLIGDTLSEKCVSGYERPKADSLAQYAAWRMRDGQVMTEPCLPFYLKQPDVTHGV